jgi:hypothetical protein
LEEVQFKMRIPMKSLLFAYAMALMPLSATADVIELSQGQLRQLVAQQQVLRAETIATTATSGFGGVVIDIRGFLSEGRMTYRLLLQRNDGSVVELLYNGTDGERVSHNSQMGQIVSSEAKSNNASNGNANGRGNANANASRGNNGNSGDRGNRGNSGSRGNSGDRGNSGNGGKGNGRGN